MTAKPLRIFLGSQAVAQPRARHVPVGRGKMRRVVSTADKKVKAYREHLIALLKREAKAQGWVAPSVVDVSWTAYVETAGKALWGRYCPVKPDRDNVDKLVLDCAKVAKIVKDDDSVADGRLLKVWAECGGWEVTFRSLEGAVPPDPDDDDLGVFV